MNGKQQVLSVKLKPEVVDPDDVEMLEDLILAALHEAQAKTAALIEEEMGKVTGGMGGLPGLF